MRRWGVVAVTLASALLATRCVRVWETRSARPGSSEAESLDAAAPFAKCHLKTGHVVVLERWQIEPERVTGEGIEYDADRKTVRSGAFNLNVDEVLLLETTRPKEFLHSGFVTLGVVTGASLAATALCAANPKACFGSCPTFYRDSASGPRLVAEGFSGSVAPAFENADVDALAGGPASGGLRLTVTNEALETHAIRSARLLALRSENGTASVRVGGGFRGVGTPEPLLGCDAESGSCLELVSRVDGREYRSWTDGENLGAVERVRLRVGASSEPRVLVIEARQTLLTTFLFYQLLAYAGSEVGEWFALIERAPELLQRQLREGAYDLGNVEVWAADGARLGTFREVGPLAPDVQGVALPPSPEAPLELELRMKRGNFRIDALWTGADLGAREPISVPLARVSRAGREDAAALATLLDPERHLLTYPGDRLELAFELPEGQFDVFLESRGYYYEWMRESWLEEESRERLDELIYQPGVALERLAAEYQRIERDMEPVFWASRFSGRPLREGP